MAPVMHPQTQSRLCSLPPELRSKIYGYALFGDSDPQTSEQPSVSRTCPTLRVNELTMFYSINKAIVVLDGTREN